ncbi:MAG: hypothetical protein A4E72_00972 [Syntrophus sp. PtaU1.Bin208]|nr:MAG: hypothetical protein A4E72_00972 [Syntrophus sp. PtaU1.Bin208]
MNVRAPDHLDRLDDIVGVFLEFLLKFGIDGQHGGRAVRVSRMHPHGVDILDEADGDHPVLFIADDFQFQFLPAENGLFNEDLTYPAGRNAAAGHGPEFFRIVDESAPRAAHGISRADDHGIAEFGSDFFRLLHGIGRFALRHVDTQARHGFLEGYPVFAALDGVHLDADDLNAVFFQDSQLGQFRRQVQSRLPAEVWEDGIGFFIFDDFNHGLDVQGLDVGDIGHSGVRHDCGRIGVDQDNFVTEFPQGLAGLGAGIVKFTGLSDDNGPGTDNHDFFEIVALRHEGHPPEKRICGAV